MTSRSMERMSSVGVAHVGVVLCIDILGGYLSGCSVNDFIVE